MNDGGKPPVLPPPEAAGDDEHGGTVAHSVAASRTSPAQGEVKSWAAMWGYLQCLELVNIFNMCMCDIRMCT